MLSTSVLWIGFPGLNVYTLSYPWWIYGYMNIMDVRCRHGVHVNYRPIVLSARTSEAEHEGNVYIYQLNSIYDKHDDYIVTS